MVFSYIFYTFDINFKKEVKLEIEKVSFYNENMVKYLYL